VPFTDHPLRRAGCRALALLTLGLVACAPPRPPAPSTPAAPPRPSTAAPSETVSISDRARNWDEYRLRAAHRLAAANADRVYAGPVPEPLLAIPVLEIELNADGSVRHIIVQREPSQAKDTVQLAIDAVRRAAPFGQVSHLPRPWKFSEVFLFDDDRKFKPRLLDQ
jgi:hypothetical protein